MSKETDNSEILAVILSELKKLTKHFKLDRRKQGGEDNPAAVEVSATHNETLRQITETVKELLERKSFTEEQDQMLRGLAGAAVKYIREDQSKGQQEIKTLLANLPSINNETTARLLQSIEELNQKTIPVDTERFRHLTEHFIWQIEQKIKKVKRPSKGLQWYIVMWSVTLLSAFLPGYFIHERQQWKDKALYWYQQYQDVKPKGK